MILSHTQIEGIAVAVTEDFNQFFFGAEADEARDYVQATPIDQFARDYLGLEVSFAKLSQDGSICGVTAYADTECRIEEGGEARILRLRQNQVILDESFIQPGQVRKLCGKRRFTLAHECAHQLLYQCASDDAKVAFRGKYAAHTAYSMRDLKTREDWNEWQANALGAAILMPQKEIDLAMWRYAKGRKLTDYEGKFTYSDRLALSLVCQSLGVSGSAAVIRLRQLGYLDERPYAEYADPMEVWA